MKCDCGTDMEWKREVNNLNGLAMITPLWVCPDCGTIAIDDQPLELKIRANERKIAKMVEGYDYEI